MKLQDGNGSGRLAKVNSKNELAVFAVTEPEDKFNNRSGKVWSITSSTTAVGTDDYIFYFKNTGSEVYAITDVRAYSSAATTLSIDAVSGTPTFAAGSDLTPVNRNLGRSDTMTATIKEDTNTTGLTDNGQLFFIRLDTANEQEHLRTSSNILITPGQAIALTTSAATLVTCLWSFTTLEDLA